MDDSMAYGDAGRVGMGAQVVVAARGWSAVLGLCLLAIVAGPARAEPAYRYELI